MNRIGVITWFFYVQNDTCIDPILKTVFGDLSAINRSPSLAVLIMGLCDLSVSVFVWANRMITSVTFEC